MKRATRTSLTIAMATVMIGFVVTQARADRVSYTVDRCFGAGCVTGSARIGELSLAFTESGLGVVDSAVSATALANFSPEMSGVSGLRFAGASVKSQSSADASAAQRSNSYQANTSSLFLPATGMSLSFSRLQTPVFASSMDLGRSVSAASNGSFSMSSAGLSANKPLAYGATNASPGPGDINGAPGGAPAPEPTTMLLLGTGLAGAAAIARKRLKARGRKSK
jgi:hypothetical protein